MATPIQNKPLIVVDGVVIEETDLAKIDANEIESIDILKDIPATVIYGYRATQGVIIIRTKNANQRVIKVKDFFSGEALPAATVELVYNENGKESSWYQQTDSAGEFNTNKISNVKLYKLKVSCIGYKTYVADVNAKTIGRNYTVLLEKDYLKLSEVVITSYASRTIRCGGCWGIRVLKDSSFEKTTEKQNTFRIYPNPVERGQKIIIEFASENQKKLTMRLFGIDGKLINSKEYSVVKRINQLDYSLDSKLTPGLYIVQIIEGNDKLIMAEKLIIQ